MYEREGVSSALTDRVFARLLERKYIDDEKFARWWVENRNLTKGASRRKIVNELRAKGVETSIIDGAIDESERNDDSELVKIIAKKRARYPDDQKFIQYLMRQGFSYDTIKSALAGDD
jgi:regulatory protein